jgi:hypothetical protein
MTRISRGVTERAFGLGRAAESDSLAELASEPVVR